MHARQFDEQVPDRPAGSQEEQIASTYILGHLQQAGYVVRLEAIPVADLIRSTAVIALPPGGEAEVVVAVPYDTGPRSQLGDPGLTLGIFLELARAMAVAVPEHRVQFVALGAESGTADGGSLGSRRLINLLRDDDLEPSILTFRVFERANGFAAGGAAARDLEDIAAEMKIPVTDALEVSYGEPFRAAGLPFTAASGDVTEVGDVLLEWLGDSSANG